VGLARDCARDLPYVFDNIHDMAALFARTGFVFAENDSRDATPQILRAFGAHRPLFHCLNFDGIAKRLPERTRRFAFLRNKCISVVRADPDLRGFDYLIVMDMDDMNNEPLDRNAVVEALAFLDRGEDIAGVFANSRGPYYDMWTLREPRLCPIDPWEEVFDYALAHRVDDHTAYEQTFARRIFTLQPDAPPLEVTSAFGGLGIYKLRYALQATYKGDKPKEMLRDGKRLRFKWQSCEHVAFNEDIVRRGGRLFVLPFLCNVTTKNLEFGESFYRTLIT